MAPREATNLFPDHYLTLDYDTNGGGVVPPTAVAPPVVVDHNNNNNNNNVVAPTGLDHLGNGVVDDPMNGGGGVGGGFDGNLLNMGNNENNHNTVQGGGVSHNGTDLESSLSFLQSENHNVVDPHRQQQQPPPPPQPHPSLVDPLSIDPTNDDEDEDVEMGDGVDESLLSHEHHDPSTTMDFTLNGDFVASTPSGLSRSDSVGSAWAYPSGGSSGLGNGASMVGASDDGGGFGLFSHRSTATNGGRHHDATTTNIIGSLHPPNPPTRRPPFSVTPSPNSRSTRRLRSVLDQSLSVETDDDDDDSHYSCPPGLDVMTDTATTPQDDSSDDDHHHHHTFPSRFLARPFAPALVDESTPPAARRSSHNNVALTQSPTSPDTLLSTGSPIQSSPESTASFSAPSGDDRPRWGRAFSSRSSYSQQQQQRHQHLGVVGEPSMSSSQRSTVTNRQVATRAQPQPQQLSLAFGPNTHVSDLKYFAERGCIVALLRALRTPRLKTLGCRMLADYAKMPGRRAAVASNRRILEFVVRTAVEPSSTPDWLGREYAVETVRSLTATEESDAHLLDCEGMLSALATCASGGPFVESEDGVVLGTASGRARLHACIAVMNLSCGKSNKVRIARSPEVLEAMRDAMLLRHCPGASDEDDDRDHDDENRRHAREARLKATTCVKNLSNADANDGALLACEGLVEALGRVASVTAASHRARSPQRRASDATTTTNACLALMNLSISKDNKNTVFRTPGVMDALMDVVSVPPDSVNAEARVKACSALSNLAIGYDNKIPMFRYHGFVDAILNVIRMDRGEARTKACSILWSFAAEARNQVPVVRRGDILPVLVRVAEEDETTEARFKCVAALTLLAESLENAVPLLESGALAPLMDILSEAGPDPTQWKGQTASWCVGFLMNMAQSDEAVPALREAGVVELLAPLLTLDHYQSLKAAMAVTFVCRYDEGDETYDLLRKTETVIPKIVSLLHNTLAGRGGNGYKFGVFTLRSSVGCIASLAGGPDFMRERVATKPVYESLLKVLVDFCVEGGTSGAIVGGGRDDVLSPTLAIRALRGLTHHLIPTPSPDRSGTPFGAEVDARLVSALDKASRYPRLAERDRRAARETRNMILGVTTTTDHESAESGTEVSLDHGRPRRANPRRPVVSTHARRPRRHGHDHTNDHTTNNNNTTIPPPAVVPSKDGEMEIIHPDSVVSSSGDDGDGDDDQDVDVLSDHDGRRRLRPRRRGRAHRRHRAASPVRTFLLADSRGRRFAVPSDPSGGRRFNDDRRWCYRRGRFCRPDETPDPDLRWTAELERAYAAALAAQRRGGTTTSDDHHDDDDVDDDDVIAANTY